MNELRNKKKKSGIFIVCLVALLIDRLVISDQGLVIDH